MKLANSWKDYEVIATSNGEKLERWGNVKVLRPDPQIIWESKQNLKVKDLSAHYHRSESKSGEWEFLRKIEDSWVISWKDIKFKIMPMSFKHMCLFPEQAVNWEMYEEKIKNSKREIKVLNLFAYTGAASVVCAKAGAKVTHVDAAKSMIDIAKENANLNGITNIRYICEDCKKFIEREIRRGNKYDAIILDPPSFGRGPKGETWKIEDDIFDFVKLLSNLISDNPLFVLLNSYTTGLQPTVMANILRAGIINNFQHNVKCSVDSYEVCLPTSEDGIVLPCGCSSVINFNK